MDYKIIDNFLDQETFLKIQKNILFNPEFRWQLLNSATGKDLNDGISFVHLFKFYDYYDSGRSYLIKPIINKIPFKEKIWRIKANLYPRNENNHRYANHVDMEDPHAGCIFYLNTNNGKTILEDIVEIDSIANRALFFDSSKMHTSTTCSDEPYRANIIFNYFKS